MKTLLFVICLIFICSWPGCTNGIQDVALPQGLQREVIGQMNMRKLLAVDATVDYDEGGPNFSHTPGKGNPPIGAKVAN
ncbi:hypothetical protein KY290_011847 [Solanum tuberosum]|uniref:Uncharacterized protein n=1 Tax=Solanum tuberosum TaxID=4113 RepID=A0ABQ7W296_SOLTU|nr:hypothetical protein KY289_012332 [Solanum tuberosum]KAH0710515.1 hypothetical protein KY284_011942 [Solanum tuberosum]KAH0736173.1 hypothetical protein KY285_011880 [Solanum tuberosum]KAH0774710.1 hypothetical protein KY290_011847 [Solanum tuberosum]